MLHVHVEFGAQSREAEVYPHAYPQLLCVARYWGLWFVLCSVQCGDVGEHDA